MTAAHVIYIPCVLLAGIVLGFILGGRAARDAFAAQKRREEEAAARKAARAARAAGAAGGAAGGGAGADAGAGH